MNHSFYKLAESIGRVKTAAPNANETAMDRGPGVGPVAPPAKPTYSGWLPDTWWGRGATGVARAVHNGAREFGRQGINLARLGELAFTRRANWGDVNKKYDTLSQAYSDQMAQSKPKYTDDYLNRDKLVNWTENTTGNVMAAIPALAAGEGITAAAGKGLTALGQAAPRAQAAINAATQAANKYRAVRYPMKWMTGGMRYAGVTPGTLAVAPALAPTIRSQLTDAGESVNKRSYMPATRGVMNVIPGMNALTRASLYFDDWTRGMAPGTSDYGRIPKAESGGTVRSIRQNPDGSTTVMVAPEVSRGITGLSSPTEYNIPRGYTMNVQEGQKFAPGHLLGYSPMGSDRANMVEPGAGSFFNNLLKSYNPAAPIDMADLYLDMANDESKSIRDSKVPISMLSQLSTVANPLLRNSKFRVLRALSDAGTTHGSWLRRHLMASVPEITENLGSGFMQERAHTKDDIGRDYDPSNLINYYMERGQLTPEQAAYLVAQGRKALANGSYDELLKAKQYIDEHGLGQDPYELAVGARVNQLLNRGNQ